MNRDMASALFDDPVDDSQTQAGALADALGGEEGFEDPRNGDGWQPRSKSVASALTAAVLVFFAALAGAWVVAADLGAGAHWPGLFHGGGCFADHVACLGRPIAWCCRRARIRTSGGAAKGAGGLVSGLPGNVAQEVFECHQA